MRLLQYFHCVIFCVIFSFFSACASKEENNNPTYVYLNPKLPASLNLISLTDLQIRASASSINENGVEQTVIVSETPTYLTTKGYYALPTGKVLPDQNNYLFHLSVYVKAATSSITNLSENDYSEDGLIQVQGGASACTELTVDPDQSLVEIDDSQWLLLCEVDSNQAFIRTEIITLSENEIICLGDADGDGLSNLNEIDANLNPYNPDLDGDCVTDSEDAFPNDPTEWSDTDGDGVGDNADNDADADGLTKSEEEALGTNIFDSDTDDDGIMDSLDNCPLNGASPDQTDTDADGIGDICETDTDGDGLSDLEEQAYGTNPLDADSDDDNLDDKTEITYGTNPLSMDSDHDGVNDDLDAFPLDPTESVDTDNDGIGNNSDLCPDISNEGDTDIDNDGLGNLCDTDDDGDGVLDEVEIKIGSDPENIDTDGDGLTDWFGGEKSTNSDGCLLNPAFDDIDSDGDGFNSICDCEDNSSSINPATSDPADDGVDSDCDGIDGNKNNAVFVDLENGNDTNDGSYGNPVQSLTLGITLGIESEKDVYVTEGNVTLASTLTLENDVAIYGGYSSDFSNHDPSLFSTEITGYLIETSIEITEGAVISLFGLTINSGDKETDTIIMSITDSSLVLSHSRLIGSSGKNDTYALLASSSDITLSFVEILLIRISSKKENSVYGLYLDKTIGSISNTDITIENFENIITGIYCAENGSQDIILSDDSITLSDFMGKPVDPSVNFVYIMGCNGSDIYTTLDTEIPDLFGFDITNLIVD